MEDKCEAQKRLLELLNLKGGSLKHLAIRDYNVEEDAFDWNPNIDID